MAQEKFGLMAVRKIFYVLTMGVCLIAACKKSHPNNKEEELINKVKAESKTTCFCNPYLKKYLWQGETVYMRYMNGANCDGFPIFYNSNGEQFNLHQEVTFEKFLAESTFIQVLWSCKEPSAVPFQ